MNDNLIEKNEIPQFDDSIEGLLSLREWLENCLKANGAVITGGGIGMGAADVDIQLNNAHYTLSIRKMTGSFYA